MRTVSDTDPGAVLFGKTRAGVLGLLLTRPDEEFHVRRIARLTGASPGPVQRELKLLAEAGILRRRDLGHQILYSANTDSPIHAELRELVVKTVGLADIVREALTPLADRIRAAFLFGSFAAGRQRSTSDVDLMIIGDTSVAAVAGALAHAQRRLGREINPSIYRVGEFATKLRAGHHFLSTVMQEPKIFLIGDEHELRRVAEEWVDSAAPAKPAGGRRADRRHRARPGNQHRPRSR